MPDDVMQRARELLAAEGCVAGFGTKPGLVIVNPRSVLRAIAAALTETQDLRAEIARAREAAMTLAEAAGALIEATDSLEQLRPERVAVLDGLKGLLATYTAQPDREVER